MHYGGTEFGSATRYLRNPTRPGLAREDWLWFEFAPHARPRWVPQADDGSGAAELDLLSNERHVLAVENLPDVPGYATQDLFLPHPTKPGLWKMCVLLQSVQVFARTERTSRVALDVQMTSLYWRTVRKSSPARRKAPFLRTLRFGAQSCSDASETRLGFSSSPLSSVHSTPPMRQRLPRSGTKYGASAYLHAARRGD
jgi:hypothetical protein